MFNSTDLQLNISAEQVEQAKAYAAGLLAWAQSQLFRYAKTRSPFGQLEDLIFILIVYRVVFNVAVVVYGYGPFRALADTYRASTRYLSRKCLRLPVIRQKVAQQVAETHALIAGEFAEKPVNFSEVPGKGLSTAEVEQKLTLLADEKAVNWQGGQVSGAVYLGDDEVAKLQAQTWHQFSFANQLHPDAFPGVRQMEAEVVSMVLKLFNAPESGCGTTSSGGTESLLLACLAAREKARVERGVTEPEIIAPKSIHAAVFKAAKYFGMKLRLVDLDKDFRVNVAQARRLINSNTCLLMGSAPNFPYGTIDDIESLSKLAVKYHLPLHVDCCLGSFVVAYYASALGEELPGFDFRVPGVTSISCDTHKYGFTPKGSSVIMYRSQEYRKYQYFVTTEWTGGLYGSPTLAGSRPGAITAGTYATMLRIGNDGYTQSCRKIIEASRKLKAAVRDEIPALDLIGDPLVSVVSFKSDKLNVYSLSDLLAVKGWHLAALQKPSALHLCVTRLNVPVIDKLIEDLKEATEELLARHEQIKSDTAQVYGAANSLAVNSVAEDVISSFLDVLYEDIQ